MSVEISVLVQVVKCNVLLLLLKKHIVSPFSTDQAVVTTLALFPSTIGQYKNSKIIKEFLESEFLNYWLIQV